VNVIRHEYPTQTSMTGAIEKVPNGARNLFLFIQIRFAIGQPIKALKCPFPASRRERVRPACRLSLDRPDFAVTCPAADFHLSSDPLGFRLATSNPIHRRWTPGLKALLPDRSEQLAPGRLV
jgi:hypothetical protein